MIKMKIGSIDVDLLLYSKKVSSEDLRAIKNGEAHPLQISEEDVAGILKKKSLSSIQGYLCTTTIERVAKKYGINIFREVTKRLKKFFKAKCLYGTNLGFLNGMSIQVMTLFVMELLYDDFGQNSAKRSLNPSLKFIDRSSLYQFS